MTETHASFLGSFVSEMEPYVRWRYCADQRDAAALRYARRMAHPATMQNVAAEMQHEALEEFKHWDAAATITAHLYVTNQ